MVRIEPIIPVVHREPFDHPGWLFELKWGGFRGVADTVNDRMLSKNKNHFRKFDRLLRTLPPGCVFDGEIVALERTCERACGGPGWTAARRPGFSWFAGRAVRALSGSQSGLPEQVALGGRRGGGRRSPSTFFSRARVGVTERGLASRSYSTVLAFSASREHP
jgi:hypothetical protein